MSEGEYMSDEPQFEVRGGDGTGQTPYPETEGTSDGRLWGLLAGLVVLAAIILLILFIPRLSSGGTAASTNDSKAVHEIVPVKPLDPLPGVVSIWAKPGANVDEFLTVGALRGSTAVDMGNGQFIVSLPAGVNADAAVRRLKATSGIYDAGRVYSDGKTGK